MHDQKIVTHLALVKAKRMRRQFNAADLRQNREPLRCERGYGQVHIAGHGAELSTGTVVLETALPARLRAPWPEGQQPAWAASRPVPASLAQVLPGLALPELARLSPEQRLRLAWPQPAPLPPAAAQLPELPLAQQAQAPRAAHPAGNCAGWFSC